MEFDDKKGLMIFNEVDLDYILKTYIRSYRFHKDNKLPKKIIIRSVRDFVELTEPQWAEVQGKKIKIEFGGFGDTDRPVRTRGVSKPSQTKRESKSGTTEPTKSK